MSLDLPLVRGDVDPSVALRETAAPVALVRAGEADVIVVDPAGFVLLDEAGARPSDTPTLRRLAGDEAARAAEGTTASSIAQFTMRAMMDSLKRGEGDAALLLTFLEKGLYSPAEAH